MPLEVRDVGGHITLITIDNQSKRNAMSRAMLAELAALWDRLDTSGVRCVVVTGAGEKGFCAGADIGGDLSADETAARTINRALLKTSTFSKPIIAAVNGDCAGGGVELLLATDIRGAAQHARFGLPEVRYAIYPFGGATVKLVQQIGYVHAMDLLLTGRLVDTDFAEKIGLINQAVPAGSLMDWAMEKAQAIAANSPAAVQAVKTQISASIADYSISREALEQQLGDKVRASSDFAEGVAAFREKRKPNYV
ncbi:MAG: enoyl-CoA hydratase-related protein [Hyphomicrobiaceae bacterium]|jgi:enoyl-CoA hydratase